MSAKKLRRETIVWRDSWAGYDARPVEPEDIEPGYYIADCGFLAKETADEVILCEQVSAHADDGRVKYAHGIPKKAIVSRTSTWVRIPDPRKAT